MKHNTDYSHQHWMKSWQQCRIGLRTTKPGINFEPSLDHKVRQFAADQDWETAWLGFSDTVMHTLPLHWSKKAKLIISNQDEEVFQNSG